MSEVGYLQRVACKVCGQGGTARLSAEQYEDMKDRLPAVSWLTCPDCEREES